MQKTNKETERQRMAREHAEHLLAHFGLAEKGWTFRWNRRRQKLGMCYFPVPGIPGRIEVSIYHAEHGDFSAVDDTIRHEIAHALAGKDAGHGPAWQTMCVVTGAQPERLAHTTAIPGNWSAACPTCQLQYHRVRQPTTSRLWFCRLCGLEKGRLTWALSS